MEDEVGSRRISDLQKSPSAGGDSPTISAGDCHSQIEGCVRSRPVVSQPGAMADTSLFEQINALHAVNAAIGARLEAARRTEVTQFKFILSHDPLRIDLYEWRETVATILNEWRNAPAYAMQPIASEALALPTPFATTLTAYADLARLNTDYAAFAHLVVNLVQADKTAPYLTAVLRNLEVLQVALGELETAIFQPNNDIASATRLIDTIERCMGALARMPNVVRPTQLHFQPRFPRRQAL